MDLIKEEKKSISDDFDFDEILDRLKQQAEFYQENHILFKQVLTKLHLLKDCLNLESQGELNKLVNCQETYQITDCKPESLNMSHVDQLRKQNMYIAKVKTCRKMYINLNEKLTKEIKRLRAEYEHSKDKMNKQFDVSTCDLKAVEIKINRYEEQLAKFEEKYPWLNNSELNLHNISKEINSLNTLKQRKIKLMEELEEYEGLKPDVTDARMQLNEIKNKYEELNTSFKKQF